MEYDEMVYEAELQNRDFIDKYIIDPVYETWNIPRALRATSELSPLLVQAGFFVMTRPLLAAKAIGAAFRDMIFPSKAEKHELDRKRTLAYQYMKEDKLVIVEEGYKLSKKQELFMSNLVPKIIDYAGWWLKLINPKAWDFYKKQINPARVFERGGAAIMNTVAEAMYLEGVKKLSQEGKTRESYPEDYKEIANIVNTFTGRTNLGPLENATKLLSFFIFSPRMWAGVLKTMTPYALIYFGKKYSVNPVTGKKELSVAQKMAIKEYIRFFGTTATIMMMISALFGDDDDEEGLIKVVTDPKSSDFMKYRVGKNIRIDPWGGRQQMIVFQSRFLANAMTRTGSDTTVKLGTGMNPSMLNLAGQLSRNKLSPSAQLLWNYLDKRENKYGESVNRYGEPYDLSEETLNNLYPIYYESLFELWQEDPSAMAAFLTGMSFFGLGVNVYDEKDKGKLKPLKPIGEPLKPLKPVQ